MAEEVGPGAVGDDPDYERGGSDSLVYRVPLAELAGKPAAVQATLYYQATPPFYLQDRFCTSSSTDTKRLYLRGRQAEPRRHAGAGLEAAGGDQRAGEVP